MPMPVYHVQSSVLISISYNNIPLRGHTIHVYDMYSVLLTCVADVIDTTSEGTLEHI